MSADPNAPNRLGKAGHRPARISLALSEIGLKRHQSTSRGTAIVALMLRRSGVRAPAAPHCPTCADESRRSHRSGSPANTPTPPDSSTSAPAITTPRRAKSSRSTHSSTRPAARTRTSLATHSTPPIRAACALSAGKPLAESRTIRRTSPASLRLPPQWPWQADPQSRRRSTSRRPTRWLFRVTPATARSLLRRLASASTTVSRASST